MKKLGLLIIVFNALICSTWAVPARRDGIVKTQPDGSQVTVYQHGDEHFHWTTNKNGEWLKMDIDGFYRVTEAMSEKEIEAKRMTTPSRATQKSTPLNIAPRGLVILVNFQDLAFETTKLEMDSMLTAENYTREYEYTHRNQTYHITSRGSARQYFYDSSHGQYDPQFDVVGPVTVSEKMSHYGKNTAGFDANPWQMVKEACELVNDSIDFTLYDNDDDGCVDFVYVIYAGFGEADGGDKNTIWPHSYALSSAGTYCKVDEKQVDLYACGNELDYFSKKHTGIGTFCHEFSHVLGLPDMYETTGNGTHKTLGAWSIMDYGSYNNESNTPPAYSAYERFFMGWLSPQLIVDSAEMQLPELNSSNHAMLIAENDQHNLIGNDPDTTVFYLLENRQQSGWDEYLPGHGMMLTKVDYKHRSWSNNTVNNNSKDMGVDLIEAKVNKGPSDKATDLFPEGATKYLHIKDHSICNIKETEGVIHFRYRMVALPEEEEEEEEKEDEEKEEEEDVAVEDVFVEHQVQAIYNTLGQKQTHCVIEHLPQGTYIVVTTSGTYKIAR